MSKRNRKPNKNRESYRDEEKESRETKSYKLRKRQLRESTEN